jgi:hypothetical protein
MRRVRKGMILSAAALALLGVSFVVGRNFGPFAAATASQRPLGEPADDTAALADGVVTEGEYAAAFGAYLACAREKGFELATPVSRDRFGVYSAVLARADAGDGAIAHGQVESCRQAELNDIEHAWVLAHPPTAAERKEARDLTAACLADADVSVARQPTREELRDVLVNAIRSVDRAYQAVVLGCFDRTADELNWPGYGGG